MIEPSKANVVVWLSPEAVDQDLSARIEAPLLIPMRKLQSVARSES